MFTRPKVSEGAQGKEIKEGWESGAGHVWLCVGLDIGLGLGVGS